MIVLVDQEQMTVTICDEKVVTYNWSDIEKISVLLEHENVVFVTDAQIVPGTSVVKLISETMGRDYSPNVIKPKRTGPRYYHATTNSQLIVQSDGNDVIFYGISDFKPINSIPKNVVQNLSFQMYVKLGKIEIVDEVEKIKIEKKIANRRPIFVSRDESIDNLIVKDSDRGTAEKIASGDIDLGGGDEIAESIDLSEEANSNDIETEALSNINSIKQRSD